MHALTGALEEAVPPYRGLIGGSLCCAQVLGPCLIPACTHSFLKRALCFSACRGTACRRREALSYMDAALALAASGAGSRRGPPQQAEMMAKARAQLAGTLAGGDGKHQAAAGGGAQA